MDLEKIFKECGYAERPEEKKRDQIYDYYDMMLFGREINKKCNKHIVVGSALPKLIPLLISYFYPTTPASNSDEMFQKRMQIIEILNDLKAD